MWKLARAMLVTGLAIYCAACATSSPQPLAPPPSPARSGAVLGIASWYGPGFDGRRTSSGATYHQDSLTAASTVFPLGTVLRVTNLRNQRSVVVTVDDHGPYVKGRTLDLSHKAARTIGMIGRGTTPVRMEVLHSPPGGPPVGLRYCIQIGSFHNLSTARRLRERIVPFCPDATIVEAEDHGAHLYRVRTGVFTERRAAESQAGNLQRLGYSPIIITE
ncbi:MAG TPA: septal ring lytic transglycosylase RlpA family protein [Candidatus Binataceae bacterium]|nr:septal ring lytic transglycosylase RlpA family protein [Candidatus Binataceae bacterium]